MKFNDTLSIGIDSIEVLVVMAIITSISPGGLVRWRGWLCVVRLCIVRRRRVRISLAIGLVGWGVGWTFEHVERGRGRRREGIPVASVV